MEQDRSKANVKETDSEQELEVWAKLRSSASPEGALVQPLASRSVCVALQVLVNLEEGVGVSLVNKVPEELVFMMLSGIRVHFTRTAAHEVLELSIQRIQVRCLQNTEQNLGTSLWLHNTGSCLCVTVRWTTSCWAPPSR